jgi:archaellum component FlaF (FlaF/FlaG flagellin family)
MTTVDKLLIELYHQGIDQLDAAIPTRDKKILISLSKQIISGRFLTENQSNLLVKILKENLQFILSNNSDAAVLLDTPKWSQQFRVLAQVRKIYLSKSDNGQILVEFTYNKRLRQMITDINKLIEGQLLSVSSTQYSIPLTEKNIFTVVKTFKSSNFEIDSTLMKFYEEIVEILKKPNSQFEVFNITNEKIISSIKNEIGDITEENITLLNDRSHRFQYSIFQKNPEKSVANALANRKSTRVWLDSTATQLGDVIDSLVSLKRFPLLIILDGHNSSDSLQNIKKLENSLKHVNFDNQVGIYFRFDNATGSNKEFNGAISELKYNTPLTEHTMVAGIANNKLPKFMISSNWRPKSVISFSNNFKNNKTSMYCDDVDLIVYYNDKCPLGGIDAVM